MLCLHNHFSLEMQRCFSNRHLMLFYPVTLTGPKNNPRVQGHPRVPDGGRGGGVDGGPDHIHEEPRTRSVC